MSFSTALKKLRKKNKKRKFDQTLDLIINLKDFDLRKDSANTFVILPNINKRKKICAFLENSSKAVDYVITKNELERISQRDVKKMVKEYDFFISNAKLMPRIASKFGKILGTAGKMPNPKIGNVLAQVSEDILSSITKKLSNMTKIRTKESSIKVAIGKESMLDDSLIENAEAVLKAVTKVLPKKELNIKSILLKFTMSPTIKVEK